MFPRGSRVGVAVSGGADSVCLLHVLKALSADLGIALRVVHVNHQLRGADSDADEAFVTDLARTLDLEATIDRVDLAGVDPNLEQAGREARLTLFRRLITDGLVDRVATGHTRNDQAETVLYRLLRGSGTAGLAGILPTTRQGVVRPLIRCSRPEVEQYLRARDLPWRDDVTNASPTFVRNRIRHQLIPLLERDYTPALSGILAATASVAQDEEDYWAGEIHRLGGRLLRWDGDAVVLNVADLHPLAPAVTRRLVRYAIELVKGDLRGIDILHVERILTLAAGLEGSGRVQAPGVDVFRSFAWMRIGRPRTTSRAERDYEFVLTPPAVVEVPGSTRRISLDLVEIPSTYIPPSDGKRYNAEVAFLDGDCIRNAVEVRNWRPGDQIALESRSTEKIKSLFQQHRIPIWERQGWPLIASGDKIVWTRRFGISADCAPGPYTRRLLRITESDVAGELP